MAEKNIYGQMALEKINSLSTEELEIYKKSMEAIDSNPMISLVDQALGDTHPHIKLDYINKSLNERKTREAPERH